MKKSGFKRLIFDVNETLLDLQQVKDSVRKRLNGNSDTVRLWFERMLHYSMVETACHQYHNFDQIAAASLQMLASERGIELTGEEARDDISAILSAPPHPDVVEALEAFSASGFKMAALSNSSTNGLKLQLNHAGIDHFFERQMSIETLKVYKPDRSVYEWAANQMTVSPEECLFIAAHAWDVAGAAAAGMATAFIQRSGQSLYPLSPVPQYVTKDLLELYNALTQ